MRFLFLFFLTVFFVIFLVNQTLGLDVERVKFENGDEVNVEMAKTITERRVGLLGHDRLEYGNGMLFAFDQEGIYTFHTKGMKFPIDILWIDSDLKIVDMTKGAYPCLASSCEKYSPGSPVKYVLEVPAGFVDEGSIEEGNRIYFGR